MTSYIMLNMCHSTRLLKRFFNLFLCTHPLWVRLCGRYYLRDLSSASTKPTFSSPDIEVAHGACGLVESYKCSAFLP